MKNAPLLGHILLAAALASSNGCNAHSDGSQEAKQQVTQRIKPTVKDIAVHTVPGKVPEESDVKLLMGEATASTVSLANAEPDGLLSDRILDGFQAAPTGLATDDGHVITWGFKYKEANLQSVAVQSATGQLQLVAIVNDVLRLAHARTDTITSRAVYEKTVKQLGLQPVVIVFARDEAALNATYPLLKRWLEANFLGFGTSCSGHAAVCELMSGIELPTRAYVASSTDGGLLEVAVPNVPAASIALEKIAQ